MNDAIKSKDLFFERDGKSIRGRLYMPAEYDACCPLVIFAHGFGSCFAELEHYGPVFADAGIACLLFDFCGGSLIGSSDGSMEEMSALTEISDMETVLKAAKEIPKIDPDAVFLMGESLGGAVAAYVGAKSKISVKGLILWYPALMIGDSCRKRSQMTGPEKYDFYQGLMVSDKFIDEGLNLDIYQTLSEYKGPVQIIHGDYDEVVPISSSVSAVKQCKDADLLIIPGAVHGFEGEECRMAINSSIQFVKKQENTELC